MLSETEAIQETNFFGDKLSRAISSEGDDSPPISKQNSG